jgi:hypothetical protein
LQYKKRYRPIGPAIGEFDRAGEITDLTLAPFALIFVPFKAGHEVGRPPISQNIDPEE